MNSFGKSSLGHSQGVPKISRAPIYGAHCAVIFAIAQKLSCYTQNMELSTKKYQQATGEREVSGFCDAKQSNERVYLESKI